MSALVQLPEPSPDELLEAAGRLNPRQLVEFARRVSELAAERTEGRLSATETELMQRINRPKPARLKRRYRELIRKRDDDTLTAGERKELLSLTDEDERFDVDRLEALTELARLRDQSLRDLMRDLGIAPNRYA